MELNLPTVEVNASTTFKTEQFDIGDKRVVMNILRHKMYSNPIYTICQEVMSNARDANREVGKHDVPIEVKLPSKLVPTFYIKDYGPGITPDRMLNVFIRYGNSTKRSSADQTGGFGLGAKSPFAYSDSFTVVTVTPDVINVTDETATEMGITKPVSVMMRREYIAYIDETQLGAMSLVKEERTEEPQGTTIIVPVKTQDFQEFRRGVHDVALMWNPRPKVVGVEDWTWAEPTVWFEGNNKDWALYSQGISKSLEVLIDGVPYDLQLDTIYKGDIPEEIKSLANCGLRMFFKVNDLLVTANREDLDYQPQTIQKIQDRLSTVMQEIRDKFASGLAEQKTYKEACLYWYKLRMEYHFLPKAVEWQGKKLRDSISFHDYDFVTVSKFSRTYDDWVSKSSSQSRSIHFDEEHIQVFDDTPTKTPSLSRLKTVLDWNPKVKVIEVVRLKQPVPRKRPLPTDPHYGDKQHLKRLDEYDAADQKKAEREHKNLEDELYFSALNPILLSTMPHAKVPKSTTVQTPIAKVKKWRTDCWGADENGDIENGQGVFVELYASQAWLYRDAQKCADLKAAEQNSNSKPTYELGDCGRILEIQDMNKITKTLNIQVTGVLSRYVNILGPGWQPLKVRLTEEFDKLKNDPDVINFRNEVEHLQRVPKSWKNTINDSFLGLIVDPKSLVAKLVDTERAVRAAVPKIERYHLLLDYLKISDPLPKKKRSRLKIYVAAFSKRYPLFLAVENRVTKSILEDLALYISVKDAVHKSNLQVETPQATKSVPVADPEELVSDPEEIVS